MSLIVEARAETDGRSRSPAIYAGTPGVRHMVILALMAAGFSTVELITNNLIPITCRHFTDNAFVIAAILATNRLLASSCSRMCAGKAISFARAMAVAVRSFSPACR
ncbi:MAG: hypothetical protein L0Z50_01860 [Verrucomicrobiales bacterium]|nr:hypothetical protein [Verrucomicrobiales bacterium]